MAIIVKSVFEEDDKVYSQISLLECLYELQKCCNTIELMFQKELTLINQTNQKNVYFVIIAILKILVINLNHWFVMVVMMY